MILTTTINQALSGSIISWQEPRMVLKEQATLPGPINTLTAGINEKTAMTTVARKEIQPALFGLKKGATKKDKISPVRGNISSKT